MGVSFFDSIINRKPGEAFADLINLELEEDEIASFQRFFTDLIKKAIEINKSFPMPAEKIGFTLQKANQIDDIDTISFQELSTYYLNCESRDRFYVMGDIHGDKNALSTFVQKTNLFSELKDKPKVRYVFLGDYIDRGLYGLNVLLALIYLKIAFPENIFLLRGNHEIWVRDDSVNIVSTVEGDNMFIDFWKDYFQPETIAHLKDFFDCLPVILILSNRFVLVHGGIPRPDILKDGDSYHFLDNLLKLNDKEVQAEMLWARPEPKDNVIITYGSPHYSFARCHFDTFMDKIGADLMIRAHDPYTKGYEEFYDSRLISIFSTGGQENSTSFYNSVNPCYLVLENNDIFIDNIFPVKTFSFNYKEIKYDNYSARGSKKDKRCD